MDDFCHNLANVITKAKSQSENDNLINDHDTNKILLGGQFYKSNRCFLEFSTGMAF
jgi:hypothetical protein